jgi:MFS family permease
VTTTVACVVPVFLVGGLAVQIAAELGFSPAGLGLAVSVYFGCSALASVPAGTLVERYGARVTARAGITLAGGCLLAIAFWARTFPVLVVLLAASAAANALGQLASNAALSRLPPRRQGLSFGLKQAAIPMATLLAGVSVPALALTLGWRWAFGLAGLAAGGALLLVPSDGHVGRRAVGRVGPGRATTALVVVGLAAALASGAAGSLGAFLVDATVAGGLAPGMAGWLLTFGSAVCVAGRIAGGWLADRRSGGHLAAIAVLLATGAVGLVLVSLPGTVALLAGVVLAFGLGWSWPGLVNFAVVRLHPGTPAAATSITQTGVYAGACLGPLGFGALATGAGYPAAWRGAAGAMLLATAMILLGRRLVRRSR